MYFIYLSRCVFYLPVDFESADKDDDAHSSLGNLNTEMFRQPEQRGQKAAGRAETVDLRVNMAAKTD